MNIRNLFRTPIKNEILIIESDNHLKLDPSQIIYVEGKFNKPFNDLLESKFSEISYLFAKNGFELIYFPAFDNTLLYARDSLLTLMNYYYPSLNAKDNDLENLPSLQLNLSTYVQSQQLFSALGYEKKIRPGFLRLVESPEETDNCTFEYFQLNPSEKREEQLINYLERISPAATLFTALRLSNRYTMGDLYKLNDLHKLSNIYKLGNIYKSSDLSELSNLYKEEERIVYLLGKTVDSATTSILAVDEDVLPDFFAAFDNQNYRSKHAGRMNELITNLKNNRETERSGIYENILRVSVEEYLYLIGIKKSDVQKYSRLVVIDNSKYAIKLPDYDNIEIKMTTLPKAVFILFLRHPEGIVLKQIADYESELKAIYKVLYTGERDTMDKDMDESIKRLCSPLDNALNEKLSRIREAFEKKISKTYAENYYVAGERGKVKKIKIERELISLPGVFDSIPHTPIPLD